MEENSASEAFSRSFARFREKNFDEATDDALKKEGQKILDKYAPKNNRIHPINAHSVFWMMASIAVFYYTDFYLAVRYDPKINRFYFYPAIALIGLSTSIGMFLIFYYHYYLGISDYENKHPFAIPIATASFIFGMIILCVALWPVWSIFTPFILFTLFMGFIFFFSVLPI